MHVYHHCGLLYRIVTKSQKKWLPEQPTPSSISPTIIHYSQPTYGLGYSFFPNNYRIISFAKQYAKFIYKLEQNNYFNLCNTVSKLFNSFIIEFITNGFFQVIRKQLVFLNNQRFRSRKKQFMICITSNYELTVFTET